MPQKMINREFFKLAASITGEGDFKRLRTYRHHIRGTVYRHSLKVAYLCYKHREFFGTKIDAGELVRGALLHDYYLYDRRDKASPRFHWLMHPRYALKNALMKYPSLTKNEQDMILRHMFPLTLTPPLTRAGWIICFYDKAAAISDLFEKATRRKNAGQKKRTYINEASKQR